MASPHTRHIGLLLCAVGLVALPSVASAQVQSASGSPVVNFESGPTRQVMMSADNSRLLVLNTKDHRLEIHRIDEVQGVPDLVHEFSVFTGLEPGSMANHPQAPELVYVSNLLSDSVAVVDITEGIVVTSIPVGDEPRDIEIVDDEFFVACARAKDANGDWVDHALVVHDLDAPYAQRKVADLGGHKPRSLCSDGTFVYAVPQNSGNHTTILKEDEAQALGLDQLALDAFDLNLPINGALIDVANGAPAFERGWEIPQTARIVFDHEYPQLVPQLTDRDVSAMWRNGLALSGNFTSGVGTTLFAIEYNPTADKLWVANTDARNRTRMEYNLTGDVGANRITIVDTGAGGQANTFLELLPPLTSKFHSQPTAIAFHPGQGTAYVAALGTATVIVFDAGNNTVIQEIDVPTLPGGLAVDETRDWLFVYSRLDKVVSVYDIAANHVRLGGDFPVAYDPEPVMTAEGRRVLYDADPAKGGGSGLMSCSSCHVFGDTDGMAWDLGSSQGTLLPAFPGAMGGSIASFSGQVVADTDTPLHNPMKGPMVTQSLRGMIDGEPFHWRGDRPFFQNFQPAFKGLNGGGGVSDAEMQKMATFVDSMVFPPNPYQDKNRTYSGDQQQALEDFAMPPHPGIPYRQSNQNLRCNDCHSADFDNGNFLGADNSLHGVALPQIFNTATLRGVYEKEYRDVTGFGTSHDGALDGVLGFLEADPFGSPVFDLLGPVERERFADFVRAWDTGLSPMVGVQANFAGTLTPEFVEWVNLARPQAIAGDLDIVAHGWRTVGPNQVPSSLYLTRINGNGPWRFELEDGTFVTTGTVRTWVLAGDAEYVFTAVPAGLGRRLGPDRDEDGLNDGAERDVFGSLPYDPDTDDDGYDDGLEVSSFGGDPVVPNQFVLDVDGPTIEDHSVSRIFTSTATLTVLVDEPTVVEVTVSGPGGTIGTFSGNGMRRLHQILLDGLPAGTALTYDVTATQTFLSMDTSASGGFTTVVPNLHVSDMTLSKSVVGQTADLTAEYTVVDRQGNPISGVPVQGRFAGDPISGMTPTFEATTNGAGVATFTLTGVPTAPGGTVFLSLDFLGSLNPLHPYYVGEGGGTASFYYEGSANEVNYDSVVLP